MGILVIGVGLTDIAAQAVDGDVHLGELDRFQRLFLTIDEEARVFSRSLAFLNELGRLNKHAAGTAGRIKDRTLMGFDDLHHEPDN